ncbi:unnamed protein product, partial [Tuber aestivum]
AIPFYLFTERNSLQEDFYFVLLKNLEGYDEIITPPLPLRNERTLILFLVQRLNSMEEHLQPNLGEWITRARVPSYTQDLRC